MPRLADIGSLFFFDKKPEANTGDETAEDVVDTEKPDEPGLLDTEHLIFALDCGTKDGRIKWEFINISEYRLGGADGLVLKTSSRLPEYVHADRISLSFAGRQRDFDDLDACALIRTLEERFANEIAAYKHKVIDQLLAALDHVDQSSPASF